LRIWAIGKHLILAMQPNPILSDIQGNLDLWYRIQVLLYDLNNVGSNTSSEKRLSATTNELYISAPYFTPTESEQILSTLVESTSLSEASSTSSPQILTTTIQDAIHQKLANFFEKRKASGDARPCGPHDMLPIYLDVFKVQKGDLKDERFVGRLRRSGLGNVESKGATNTTDTRDDSVSSRKKGKKGKKGR
ncbi:MAG: hypothetical protein Q9220_007572, partial [cf. Caloplaca sp. 1 TL-2023]